ncbi:MAG TPA: GspE/PulE family protein [Candidatus Limnocylindria bacterium]|jgi:type II secretory ATPase GspE/PulE/Tfp pilus assembly ATPase PilB-like protein|nr:GspE/PulE family protein [Candidatus Limnocylindria bacterium]
MSETIRFLQSCSSDADIDTVRLVDCVIIDAVRAGASDIHIEPWESSIAVRVRLSGVLNELVHLPSDLLPKIAGRLKVMANLIGHETQLPQEGRASTFPEAGNVVLRVSTFPTIRGEKIVIRIFDPTNRSFDLNTLGMEEETLAGLKTLLTRPTGLILLTGPTGSGKTTAIYAALSHIIERAGPSISVATVEDPVEFNLSLIAQSQCNPARDYTYPIALRSLMRQDPQVIMIGEIRDAETANIAVQAGLTGHLVISTIHSGSTAGVFARLINMGIEPFLLSSAIVGVLGLRLVRKNCPVCTESYRPEDSVILSLPQELHDTDFRRGMGCAACSHTGYSGRVTVTESLLVDEVIRAAILQKLPTKALQEVAIGQGMNTLWNIGLRRVLRGETSIEEILRVIGMEGF